MREITVFIKHRLDIIFILTIYTFHFIPKSYHSKIIPDFKQDVRKIRAPLKPIFDLAAANISKQIIYVEEGEKVEISCAPELYSFNDTIKLEWFKNSNPLDKSEPTIMIEKVTRSMMGTTFRCAMYNQSKFPYMYKDMKILVEWGPKVQINPLVIETDRQGQIDISCYADAFPAPLIKWYFDLSQTSATDELVYESTGLYLNITTNDLENCRFHNRNLTCSASNTLKNLAKPGSLPERTDKRILSINIQGCENILYVVTKQENDKPIPWFILLLILIVLLIILILLLSCLLYAKRNKRNRYLPQESTSTDPNVKDKPKKGGATFLGSKDLSSATAKIIPPKNVSSMTLDSVSMGETARRKDSKDLKGQMKDNLKDDKNKSKKETKDGKYSPPNSSSDDTASGSERSNKHPVPKQAARSSLLGMLGLAGHKVPLRPKIDQTEPTFMPVQMDAPRVHNISSDTRRGPKTSLRRSSSPFGRVITDDPTSMIQIKKAKITPPNDMKLG